MKKLLSILFTCAMVLTMMPMMALPASVSAATSGDFKYEVLEDGTAAITGYTALATNLTIPSKVNGYTVSRIAEWAFGECYSIRNITIPSSVTSIGMYAFAGTAYYDNPANWENGALYIGTYLIDAKDVLSSAYTVRDGTTVIAEGAFSWCYSLQTITIPNSVTSMGNETFYGGDSLTSITVGADNTTYCSVNGVLFTKDKKTLLLYPAGKTATSYIVPSSVTSIGMGAFIWCNSLKSVTIGNSVTSIGADAFCGCESLQSITIGTGVTSIGAGAFSGTAYYNSEANWQNDVLYIGKYLLEADYALSGAYAVRTGTTVIAEGAFYGCDSLESITIPSGVKSIGKGAFEYCESLSSISVDTNNTAYCSVNGVLFTKDKKAFIQYPAGKTATSYIIPSSVTSIGAGAFSGCASLKSVTIGNGVTSIEDLAFFACGSLQSITIGTGVTSIGIEAFAYCESLQSITIPSSVTSMGDGAFYECASLASITVSDGNTAYSSINGVLFTKDKKTLIQYPCGKNTTSYIIPSSVTRIEDNAFFCCLALKSVTIGSNVTSIGDYAFAACESLQSVTISNGVTSIGYGAFAYCELLKNITIPNSVTSIGELAFCYCASLQKITIPDGVTSIGCDVFSSCESLERITIPSSVTSIGEMAFSYCDSLTDVYYSGSKTQWNSISIGDYNESLTSATIHYNTKGPAVKITAESATAAYASENQNASVKVTAKGDGLSYTWYIKNPGATKYVKSSVTSATYSVKMTPANSGRLVYCVVKDQYGNQVRSKTFVLRMKATITSESATAAFAKMGAVASVKVGAVGEGLTYTWYIKNEGQTKYSKSSVTSATYSTTMNSTSKNRLVYCVVKDKYGQSVKSKYFVLREAVSITTQPKNAYAVSGATAKVTVKASGDGLTYAWYFKNEGQTKYTKSSVTKATYSVTMSNASKNRLLVCKVKDKYGNTVQAKTVQLKMK